MIFNVNFFPKFKNLLNECWGKFCILLYQQWINHRSAILLMGEKGRVVKKVNSSVVGGRIIFSEHILFGVVAMDSTTTLVIPKSHELIICYLSLLTCGRLLIWEVQYFYLTLELLVPAEDIQRWCWWRDMNPRLLDYKSIALAIQLKHSRLMPGRSHVYPKGVLHHLSWLTCGWPLRR